MGFGLGVKLTDQGVGLGLMVGTFVMPSGRFSQLSSAQTGEISSNAAQMTSSSAATAADAPPNPVTRRGLLRRNRALRFLRGRHWRSSNSLFVANRKPAGGALMWVFTALRQSAAVRPPQSVSNRLSVIVSLGAKSVRRFRSFPRHRSLFEESLQ